MLHAGAQYVNFYGEYFSMSKTRAVDSLAKNISTQVEGLVDKGFPNSEFVQSLQRGLAVILAFDQAHPTMTVSEMAAAVKMTRAAARRFLLTLQALGYLESEDGRFRLKPQTLDLGYAYLITQPWWQSGQRTVEKLSAQLNQACGIGVFDRDAVTYVAYAPALHLPSLSRTVGTRLPINCTALGRVLLTGLTESELQTVLKRIALTQMTPHTETDVRKLGALIKHACVEGYALIDQEMEIGLQAISVPLRDPSGRLVAAIGLSIRDPFMKHGVLVKNFLKPLLAASAEVTGSMPR
jgi:IclR family pca regulon transcriptional regulator